MRFLTSLNALKYIARFLNDSQRIFNLSYEWVQLRQMMKNDQHGIGNVTIFFFCLMIEMTAKVNARNLVTPTCPV